MIYNNISTHIILYYKLHVQESREDSNWVPKHHDIGCCVIQIYYGGLTFVLRGELPHLWREALVELVLPWNEGLADCLFPKP